jgi:hypothetical protein
MKNKRIIFSNRDKTAPPNIKGTLYETRNLREDKYIPLSKRKYNSKGHIINEAVEEYADLVPGFPINKRVRFDQGLMVKAIQNGLVILINYAGDKDNWKGGRERVIYPMVLGKNRNTGNLLIRGWHLTGWSVSKRRNVKKEWRLFKASNIKSMMFTGDFYRLPPKGYKMNDRHMTERIIKAADFNEIRRNQDTLVETGKITDVEKQRVGKEEGPIVAKIDARNTDTMINLQNPFENEYVKPYQPNNKIGDLKLTFMKSIHKNEYVAIIGAIGTIDRTVKLYDDRDFVGNYKVKSTSRGTEIRKIKNVQGQSEFPLYTFNKVMD